MRIRTTQGTDRGMTLIEVMIASSVLLVCLVSLAALLGTSVTSSRTSRLRDEAANLANEKIEYARSLAYDRVGVHYSNGAWGDPAGDIPTPEQIGQFTVTTECTWVRSASGRAAYKKLLVHVSWEEPMPGEIDVTTMVFGKSAIIRSGDLVVKMFYRETGLPVHNATVSLTAADNSVRSVLTDTAGEGFFGQAEIGAGILSIIPPAGYVLDSSQDSSVVVAADMVSNVYRYVQLPARATVHVIDTSSNAVVGATVALRRADGFTPTTVLTDGAGDALFTGLLYAEYTATVTKAGWSPATKPFTVSIGTPQPVVPVTTSQYIGAGMVIQVTDSSETPMMEATVTVRLDGSTAVVKTGKTGTNGQISFTGLAPGYYNTTVLVNNYTTQVKTNTLHLWDQDVIDFHMLPVIVAGNLRILTQDKDGHAKGNVQVIIEGPDNYYNSTLSSDHHGVLLLNDLDPGSYTVKCFTKPVATVTVLVNGDQTAEVPVRQKN